MPLPSSVSDPQQPDIDRGTAGASARREHERRKANREQRTRERHPRIGGLLLALREPPRHEQAWARGASGEEAVAGSLASRLGTDVVLLHDRRLPRSRANVDHLAIAPSGVWVIDSKRYKGRVEIAKPLFGPPRLTIAGRDKTALVVGVLRQVALVERLLDETGLSAPVHGALCFVEAELPLLRSLSFDGVPLLYPRALARRISSGAAVLRPERVAEVAAELARRLPSA